MIYSFTFESGLSPGQVVPLVRASSRHVKVSGSIPSQSTYKDQPMNA